MKEIIIGMVSGIVAALGMGGGTILVLLLSLFTNLGQHLIQGTNLVVFVPTSITAIYMNVKNKTIDYHLSILIIIFGIIGAIIGSLISFKIESDSLKKYFGIFLIFIAIFESYTFFKQYILYKKSRYFLYKNRKVKL